MATVHHAFPRDIATVVVVIGVVVGWYFVREGFPSWGTVWPFCLKLAYAAAVAVFGREDDYRDAVPRHSSGPSAPLS